MSEEKEEKEEKGEKGEEVFLFSIVDKFIGVPRQLNFYFNLTSVGAMRTLTPQGRVPDYKKLDFSAKTINPNGFGVVNMIEAVEVGSFILETKFNATTSIISVNISEVKSLEPYENLLSIFCIPVTRKELKFKPPLDFALSFHNNYINISEEITRVISEMLVLVTDIKKVEAEFLYITGQTKEEFGSDIWS